MKKNKVLIFILIAVIAVIGIGLSKGIFKGIPGADKSSLVSKTAKYWTCSMHPTVRSDKPGKCPLCGMDLIPVEAALQEGAVSEVGVQKKILYYRNPMDPSVTSPTPMKDSMGMDYLPVYEEEVTAKDEVYGCGVKEEGHCPHCDEGKPDARCICGGHSFAIKGNGPVNCPVCNRPLKKIGAVDATYKDAASRVKLNLQQIELAGIKTEPIAKRQLSRTVRAVGTVAYDPGLTVAQEEFLTALETRQKVALSPDPDVIKRSDDIVEKSKIKLRLLGLSDEQIENLKDNLSADKSLILPQKKMWIYADIFEYDLGWVKIGQIAKVTATAFPGDEFNGTVAAINPVLDPETRSVKVRIEVDNPELKLKPQMYMDVIIEAVYIAPDKSGEVLAVSKEAVLDTGLRKIVYIDAGNGVFFGKEIKVGPEAVATVDGVQSKFYPVLSGLNGDEMVVTKGNFLIDSQSQLTGGMSVLWGGATEIKEQEHKH